MAADLARPCRHRKRDRSVIDVEITTHPIEFLGRPAGLMLSLDVTERRRAEAALQQRYEVERLINEVSTSFINLAPAELDHGLDRALEVIGRFAGARRVGLFQFGADVMVAYLTHSWRAEETLSEPLFTQGLSLGSLRWWTNQLATGESICLVDLADLPVEAVPERLLFEHTGIRALLAAPLRLHGELTGFVSFDADCPHPEWGENETLLLRLSAQIFTNALERKRAHDELEELHDQMLEVSRKSGMAEVAAGVLHNVGNVLTSVNVSTTLVRDRLRQSHISGVARLDALLREHAPDLAGFFTRNPRGKLVPDYLHQLSGLLQEERKQLADEMAQLGENVEHIKQIVAMHQGYARMSGAIETLPVGEVVEDALRITEVGLLRQHIQVVRDFAAVPPVAMDRHKVLQILINLIRNARQAVEETGKHTGTVKLSIDRQGTESVRITVSDDGVGIAPDNLARIFSHGFTTKRDGHGFGLHAGALAAQEMGATLSVQSAGAGFGATFMLDLPLAAPVAAAPDEPVLI
jgi:signal transduction histidine kinase